MSTAKLIDKHGRHYSLGKELGRGGEGRVYEVQGDLNIVAKIYDRPHKGQEEKIRALVAKQNAAIQSVAAWPQETLHRLSGEAAGFVMRKIESHRALWRLYNPAERELDFPHADWSFLILAARNTAACFETLHANGIVMGDVNPNNVLVAPNATVRLIDCDSYQVTSGQRTFPCPVGVGHFTPPELQGQDFTNLLRTYNHDNFGLGLLIFHLLFMGRHPFMGRIHGHEDLTIETAIQKNLFVYSNAVAMRTKGISLPPKVLRLNDLPSSVATQFEAAFLEGGVSRRPTGTEWLAALDAFRTALDTCRNLPSHKYLRGLNCPWCSIMANGGPDFFVTVDIGKQSGALFDLHKVWQEIASVPTPVPPTFPTWPSMGFTATPLPTRVRRSLLGRFLLFIGIHSAFERERAIRLRRAREAHETYLEADRHWRNSVKEAVARFDSKLKELETAKQELEALSAKYQKDLIELKQRNHILQLEAYQSYISCVTAQSQD